MYIKRVHGSDAQEEYVHLKNVTPEKGRWVVPVYPQKVSRFDDKWATIDDRKTPVLKKSYFSSNKGHAHDTRYRPY